MSDAWTSGDSYETYMGRWSRLVAEKFVSLQRNYPFISWLDVGCGTGALTRIILREIGPELIAGVDRSPGYVKFARQSVTAARVQFTVGDACHLPVETGAFEMVVSGLMLNFIPEPERAVAEMVRAARPGGDVAAYVWDYAGKMQFLRHFWNAASALDPAAIPLDEGHRFPICQPEALKQLFESAGLLNVDVIPLEIPTHFRDFDDYWKPFLSGQAPAPGYAVSLSTERLDALRERLRASLPFALDGSIPLTARAWAVRGKTG